MPSTYTRKSHYFKAGASTSLCGVATRENTETTDIYDPRNYSCTTCVRILQTPTKTKGVQPCTPDLVGVLCAVHHTSAQHCVKCGGHIHRIKGWHGPDRDQVWAHNPGQAC